MQQIDKAKVAAELGAVPVQPDKAAIARELGATPIGATPSPKPLSTSAPTPSLLDRVKSHMPGWSTALPIAGGIAGSALGPLGAVAGASIGESISQLGQHFMGSPSAPQSFGESANRHALGILGGAAGAAVPQLAATHAANPIVQPGWQQLRGMASRATQTVDDVLGTNLFRTPQTLMTRGLNPSDLEFQKNIPIAMNEIKAAEKHIGPAWTSIGKVRQAAEISSRENERVAKMIVLPQKDIVIPGSASVLQKSQIDAIPDAIRITNPAEYERLVQGIRTQTSKDLTLGQLNDVTVSNNRLLSPSYGKTTIDQLTQDEQIRTALRKAQTDSARRLMYEGVESVGLGGGDSLRTVKGRTGAILHFVDALDAKQNAIVAQKAPMLEEAVSTVRRGIGHANPLRSQFATSMEKPPIEQDVLTALRRWRGRSSPVQITLRPIQRLQSRMLPPPKKQLPETGMLHPDDESFVRGFSAGSPYQSHEELMMGQPQGKAVKLGPNQVPPPAVNPEGYSTQAKPAVRLGPNKVEEPPRNPEAYPESKLEKAKKLRRK